MKITRKVKRRTKPTQRLEGNPSGFRFLDEGGAAHNATIHPHPDFLNTQSTEQDDPSYVYENNAAKVPGIGTNIPGFTPPAITTNPPGTIPINQRLSPEEQAIDDEEGEWLDIQAEEDRLTSEQPWMNKLKAENIANDKQEQSKLDKEMQAGYDNFNKEESTIEDRNITDQDPTQFFNPYGGVDVMSAANLFGQAVTKDKDGKRDPLMAVASGVKVAAGLGRSIVSGMGKTTKDRYALEEIEENRRDSLIGPSESFEYGGEIMKYQDGGQEPMYRYNGANTGMSRKEFYAKQLREEGPYRDNGGNTGMSQAEFMDSQQGGNQGMNLTDRNAEDDRQNVIEKYYMTGGKGKIDPNWDDDQLNSFLEKEYMARDTNPPKSTDRMFSPLSKMEDGGSVGDNDFMTEVMTGNYATGDGSENPNVEVEKGEYIKDPEGQVTKVLGDTHENEGEKMSLPGGSVVVSNSLKLNKAQVARLNTEYGIKATTKDTYAQAMQKYNKAIGLQDLIDEETEVIEEIKKQKEQFAAENPDDATYNINLEFLSSRVKDINDEKQGLQEQAAAFFDEVYNLQESTKSQDNPTKEFKVGGRVYSEAQVIGMASKFGVDKKRALELITKMGGGGPVTPEERKNFKEWVGKLRKQGYKGEVNFDAEDLGAEAGKVQAWMAKTQPQAVLKYFGLDNPITSKGVTKLKESPKAKEIFKAAGVDINLAPGRVTAEQRVKLMYAGREAEVIDDAFILDQFQDNLWSFRNPIGSRANFQGVETPLANPMQAIATTMEAFDIDKVPKPIGRNFSPDLEDRSTLEEEKNAEGNGAFLLPDQYPLPPGGLQPHLKLKRRYGRLDPALATADTELTEIARGAKATEAYLANLPSSQREAAALQLQANKATQEANAVRGVRKFNAGQIQKTDAFNVRQGDREELSRGIDLLDYEKRMLGAVANTEDDFRNFFNKTQEVTARNFDTINNINLMNAMYENFDITNDGVKRTVDSGYSAEDALDNARAKAAFATNYPTASVKKKKKGGRVVRRKKR